MPQSRNLNTYGDIKRQLEHCRALGGAKISFDTFAQATVWVARAYTFRSLLRKQDVEMHPNVLGYVGSTPWDDMFIRHNKKARETFVLVEFNVAAVGVITSLGPQLGDLVPMAVEDANDELIKSIAALATAEGKKE